MNMDKVRETMLKDMNKEKQISKEMVPYTEGFEKQVVCCGKQSKCLEIKITGDKKDPTDDDDIVLFRKSPSCIEMVEAMTNEEEFLYTDYGDQKQESNRNSLNREIDFRDGVEELIVNMQDVRISHGDICETMDHIQSDENCEVISSWYSEETSDKCSEIHKESINPNKSKFRVAQHIIYCLTLLKGKSCTETDCEADKFDSMVKVTCCQSMSAVPNKEWREVKVVTISLRKTPKYMQILHNALCFDELKSKKPNQRLCNLHNCHFIEEMKLVKGRCGPIQIVKRYRCEQTNLYMCVKHDGFIDSDDKGTVFITKPAKKKAFYTIQDKETSRCLCLQDKAKFVMPKIKDIESIPDGYKMIITPVNCR